MPSCRICGADTRQTHTAMILGSYLARYWRCVECEYWFVDSPSWLNEAYTEAIAALDTGIMARNTETAVALSRILSKLRVQGACVDWAGGVGILTRLMRDRGFDFYWQDKYAKNELARGFEWVATSAGRIQVVTAIEVLEHVEDPIAFLTEIKNATGANFVIFSQVLHVPDTTSDWWYFVPETGQHISFYSIATLHTIADVMSMHLCESNGLYVLSDEPVQLPKLDQIARVERLYRRVKARLTTGRKSLIWQDNRALLDRLRSNHAESA